MLFRSHDIFSWKIKGDSFLLLDTLDAESLQIDKTFKNWVSIVSDALIGPSIRLNLMLENTFVLKKGLLLISMALSKR